MIKVGIIGASGYTGGELIRLLLNHPHVEIECITSRSNDGEPVESLFPNLRSLVDLKFESVGPDVVAEKCDIIFTAVPHGVTFDIAPVIRSTGKKLIDLGADYRFKNIQDYEVWYKLEHKDPEGVSGAVYGLPELFRNEIRNASLIANPGCYPTSAILGAAPLLSSGFVSPEGIIVDSKSGVSGAGRTLKQTSLFCECFSDFKAYGVASHRHTPEIEQGMSFVAGKDVRITFTPHLVPMTRGILTTMYFSLVKDVTQKDLNELYKEYYADEYFVRVCMASLPQTKAVYGSNFCDIAARLDARTGRVIVISAIDNLVKGASGQAVQNMNIICGFCERESLGPAPIFP
jgi:N-acetyl-gamma-glutamyl-phosphate reductase